VDLIDHRRTGIKLRLHKSAKALRRYSHNEEKLYPLKAAKANGFLAALLIQMFPA
jgi:hypothetical protein